MSNNQGILAIIYQVIAILTVLAWMCTKLVVHNWTETLRQTSVKDSCILFGKYSNGIFVGGRSYMCNWHSYGLILTAFIAVIFSFAHLAQYFEESQERVEG